MPNDAAIVDLPAAAVNVAVRLYEAGARSVWLFGSRCIPGRLDRSSDVDLAVEGLRAPPGFLRRLQAQSRERVDIVVMETAMASLRAEILKSRILVPPDVAVPATARLPPLPPTLHGTRIAAVAARIRQQRPRSLIDFGCGAALLIAELATDPFIEKLTGVDLSVGSLEQARMRIAKSRRPGSPGSRIVLIESLITYRDPRFLGHEAAAAVEVIEHLEPPQLEAFAAVLFGFVRPHLAFVTTPNAEYNPCWFEDSRRRHSDHRFEWTRSQFARWASETGKRHGYSSEIIGLGRSDPERGRPTQLAIFTGR